MAAKKIQKPIPLHKIKGIISQTEQSDSATGKQLVH